MTVAADWVRYDRMQARRHPPALLDGPTVIPQRPKVPYPPQSVALHNEKPCQHLRCTQRGCHHTSGGRPVCDEHVTQTDLLEMMGRTREDLIQMLAANPYLYQTAIPKQWRNR